MTNFFIFKFVLHSLLHIIMPLYYYTAQYVTIMMQERKIKHDSLNKESSH